MKLISYIILLFTLFLTGCDSDDNTGKSILDLGIQDISFEANGGSREVSINLNGNWQAVSDKSWCTVGKNANKLTLTAPLNLTIATRTAVITITEGNGEGTFTVIKAGSKFDIFPEKQPNGNWIRIIVFAFPVPYNGKEIREFPLESQSTVECVLLMSKVQ